MGICNQLTSSLLSFPFLQAEIVKRLNAICAQVIPFLSQEVRQLVSGTGLEGAILVVLQKGDYGTDSLPLLLVFVLHISKVQCYIPASTNYLHSVENNCVYTIKYF